MKIFDAHIHTKGEAPCPEKLLSDMESAGVYGGCVFSTHPKENKMPSPLSFEERLSEVLAWAAGGKGRIFPVLWIHPSEENIIEKVRVAKEAGVLGFKMICTDYYVYEEHCLALLREIARLGLPVFFHSGILWDGEVSSAYNRPLNWEALLDIEGLKFSMGHCSWPWIDECIALYGKFLNSARGAEMFFDITPGTPEIYREELLTKLYTIGYDVGDNIFFGTDCTSHAYRAEWARQWLKTDKRILDKLGISRECREKLYEKNLMRFLGSSEAKTAKAAPTTDNANAWSGTCPETAPVIRKWYERLGFPECFNAELEAALAELPISDATEISDYDLDSTDGRRNLLSLLYMCEATEKSYQALGIPEDIMLDTLRDIVTWTREWSAVKGGLYLGELKWLKRHMNLEIFKLGRLQFSLTGSEFDIPEYGIKKGEPVLEVHIPAGARLDISECRECFSRAKEFFARYFPEKEYTLLTCHSWLLDESLKKYLGEESNIIRFGNLFRKLCEDDSPNILRYLFRWDTNAVNLPYAYPTSSLAEKIKRAFLSGETFHETLGVIEKSSIL